MAEGAGAEVWGPRILAGIAFLIGAALAIGDYRAIRAGLASETWPTVQGVVTDVQQGRARIARFVYSYDVEGVAYDAYEAGFMTRPMYRARHHYSNGDGVLVHYDPSDPSRAAITPGVSWWGLAWHLIAPLGLWAAALYLLRVANR